MIINVPDWALDHFWDEPPPGHHEFWAFRFQPKCKPGDLIVFQINGKAVARATVSHIEAPGETECAGTGRFKNRWKVFWAPASFIDLRTTEVAR